jgi:hypothetical protein
MCNYIIQSGTKELIQALSPEKGRKRLKKNKNKTSAGYSSDEAAYYKSDAAEQK